MTSTGQPQNEDAACPILAEFTDGTGHHHSVSQGTREALLEAMGGSACEEANTRLSGPLVIRRGTVSGLNGPGRLILEDVATVRVDKSLPPDLPLGYHRFEPTSGAAPRLAIICPRNCFVDESLHTWGWAIQLYSVRSQKSWGIGDLADLRHLARWARDTGAGLLSIGPLDAVAPVTPQQSSPYYPSSRRFRNPIYLRVELVPGAAEISDTLKRLAAKATLRNNEQRIDRNAVFRDKMAALQCVWSRGFDQSRFRAYCDEQSSSFEQFGAYCALAEVFHGDWRSWPAEFRRSDSAAVDRFAEKHRPRVQFHKWLQWLLDCQLEVAASELPLIHDLPVGFGPGGFDAWTWQDLLADGVSIGAPPDDFNPDGQDWGLPPLVPHKLQAANYQPFIETVRAALRHAAGLRIDHVMGLFRQYWIPGECDPAHGAYVRFPADDLMSILALESHRAGTWVLGEDLGTVPTGMREQLALRSALTYRLLWFDPNPPAQYPTRSVAAATTHDLPTVAGLWSGEDASELGSLGMDAAAAELGEVRVRFADLAGLRDDASIDEAIEAAYRLLGQAPSALLLATLEDALSVEQRPNLPGTADQRPNWSLALPATLDELTLLPLAQTIANMLTKDRRETRRVEM
ncbi:4-alpha-glucanotransferase [Bremerella volcania]|uniref:4-alpha-glucanotransferase n=1 Tax=Bremerella volcania TaxID=2527984 RepID=A0A518C5S0_9BACT|nr:4-alpha-glucanotransferase [Bremerella volcania]QDU74569.1 4-alpha-glucanotransferase [Bremerella volcania]